MRDIYEETRFSKWFVKWTVIPRIALFAGLFGLAVIGVMLYWVFKFGQFLWHLVN